jgi:hypothetical protein
MDHCPAWPYYSPATPHKKSRTNSRDVSYEGFSPRNAKRRRRPAASGRAGGEQLCAWAEAARPSPIPIRLHKTRKENLVMKTHRLFSKASLVFLFTVFCLFAFQTIANGPPGALAASGNSSPSSPPSTPYIIVNTTSDVSDFGGAQQVRDLPGEDGRVSLREAIIASNNTPGAHWIAFQIPTGDLGFDGTVFTIRPFPQQLPTITGEGLNIDGSTQTLFSGNTNKVGPEVVLDGSLLIPYPDTEGPNGLEILSANNRIHCLVIHTFSIGIEIVGAFAFRNSVTGCFVGTDAAGKVALPNELCGSPTKVCYGVTSRFGASYNVMGGPRPSDRNLISGIGYPDGVGGVGVFVENTGQQGVITGNAILGNLIGTDITGKTAIGNSTGIQIKCGTTNTLIENNVIAFSLFSGVQIDDPCNDGGGPYSTGNRISQNSMFSNVGSGIGLIGKAGNDPGDVDTGPNNLMNSPDLTSAKAMPGRLVVKGTIDTPNPQTVTIEFFANPVPIPGGHPSGYGEGAIYLGKKRPDSRGTFTVFLPAFPIGTIISATATDANGNTSDFACNAEVK